MEQSNPRLSGSKKEVIPIESISQVVDMVHEEMGLDIDIIFKRTRKQDVVQARNLCIYLLHKKHYGECAIGRAFGLNHATIYHSILSVENDMEVYVGMRERVERLTNKLKEICEPDENGQMSLF